MTLVFVGQRHALPPIAMKTSPMRQRGATSDRRTLQPSRDRRERCPTLRARRYKKSEQSPPNLLTSLLRAHPAESTAPRDATLTALSLLTLTFSARASASVLDIGVIDLIGTGSFTSRSLGLDGDPPGFSVSAIGSNGTDFLSIEADIQLFSGLVPGLFSSELPPSVVGEAFTFSGYCWIQGDPSPLCSVSIDGITGLGEFTDIGGSAGLVQVFAYTYVSTIGPLPGALLAQAEVETYGFVTSSTATTFPPPGLYSGTFELIPEPATAPLAFIAPAAIRKPFMVSACSVRARACRVTLVFRMRPPRMRRTL